MAKKVARLYGQFQPENYKLDLHPDRESMTFLGSVIVTGKKTGRPSKRITFHQKNLKISKAKIFKIDKKGGVQQIAVSRTNLQAKFNELRIHADQLLFPGSYRLEIDFAGKISDQMHGIYPCYFDKRRKALIATQFESHHAREVFPCIDEPAAKATYDFTLTAPAGETVLSNTPVKSQSTSGKLQTVTFETTPIMSSYLLAFVFGNLKFTERKTKRGVSVRSYATAANAGSLDFATEVGVKCIEFFEKYFGVKYPLPKLDMVALPDFSSGAMENWGLITFRESMFFVSPKTSIETKQVAAYVISHEISHMWFGDLVTMEWWDDLWLNESFANLMEYRAVDDIFPQWRVWEQFVSAEEIGAQRRDSLPNVQPVKTQVTHPDEIGALFDPAIVYAKGGSLLNMLRHYIGEDNFRAGLKDYFNKHAYGNTSADDLWQAFSKVSKFDIGRFMKLWLNRPGFPVVSVDYDASAGKLSLNQQRLVIGESEGNIPAWPVPLASTIELTPPVLEEKSHQYKLRRSHDLLLLNNEGKSYFAAHYLNKAHRAKILDAISAAKVSNIDRLLMLHHSILLERAGLIKTIDNLELLSAYKNEDEEAVWSAMASVIGEARRLVTGDKQAEGNLNAFCRYLLAEQVKNLGWTAKKTDSPQTLRLRNLILTMAAAAEMPEIIKEGLARLAKYKQPSDLSPDIREVVYFIAARFGTNRDFDRLVKSYKDSEDADDRVEIASSLTTSRDPSKVDRLVKMMISKDVRLQDVTSWYAWLVSNYYSRPQAWKWLTTNWQWIEKNFGDDKSYDSFPRYSANAFSRKNEAADYKKFFGPLKEVIALTRTIKLGLEEIDGRLNWRLANEIEAKRWLEQWTKANS